MRRLLIAMVLVVGCGGELAPRDQIEGDWILRESAVSLQVSFHGSRYALTRVVESEHGVRHAEIARGFYAATDGHVAMRITEASCAQPYGVDAFDYTATETTLTFTAGPGSVAFSRTDGDSAAGAEIGCFADDNTFTAQPITPVLQ